MSALLGTLLQALKHIFLLYKVLACVATRSVGARPCHCGGGPLRQVCEYEQAWDQETHRGRHLHAPPGPENSDWQSRLLVVASTRLSPAPGRERVEEEIEANRVLTIFTRDAQRKCPCLQDVLELISFIARTARSRRTGRVVCSQNGGVFCVRPA